MDIRYFEVMQDMQKNYARQLEPVCRQWKVTGNELTVLLFLSNNPGYDRAADIVERRGMTKSHVSLSVGTLEHRGLLRRRPSRWNWLAAVMCLGGIGLVSLDGSLSMNRGDALTLVVPSW